MTIYDLIQKVNEENLANIRIAQDLKKTKESYEQARERQLKFAREQFENDEISIDEFATINKMINRETSVVLEQLEELYPFSDTFAEMLSKVRDSGAFISNKMMCNLLKTQTGANWTYDVVEEGALTATLFFRNSLGEIFRPQAGIIEKGGNLGYMIKKLENINWFQEYLSAKKSPNSDNLEMSLVSGQKGFFFPPFIQITLENFFKHIQIDPNHPENLIFEERERQENKDFKPHNLYYRYQRDKKAGKFDNKDGKK